MVSDQKGASKNPRFRDRTGGYLKDQWKMSNNQLAIFKKHEERAFFAH
jgi:hypothetical protein